MKRGLASLLDLLCIALVAVSLASSGFAHSRAGAPADPDLIAYLAVAGTTDGLCGAIGADGETASVDCEACRLADTVSCAASTVVKLQKLSPQATQLRHAALLRHHAKPLDPSQLSRAPPQA